MKQFFLSSSLVCMAIFCSCSAKVTTAIISPQAPLDASLPVAVIGLSGFVPETALVLGSVKVGDTGFTTNCSYDVVISHAKAAARAAGGNAIKITEHRTPSALGSSCHRITAAILHIPEGPFANMDANSRLRPDSALLAEGCAVVNFYRFGGTGALVGYDIYVGDEAVARITNNSKESLKIKALGETTFWARTESRSEVTIFMEPGYHYYIRCAIDMGIMVGRPRLEQVDPKIGKAEYESIRTK